MEESWIRWVIIGLAGTFLIHRIYKMLTRRRTRYMGSKDGKGRRHGKGKIVLSNGDSFEGEFNKNVYQKGTYRYKNGGSYTGPFSAAGKPHGTGVEVYSDGLTRYEGMFENGVRHGKGKLLYRTGAMYIGNWKNGQKEGRGRHKNAIGEYVGEFVKGKRHGKGTMKFNSGDLTKYHGRWKEGKWSGKGTLYFTNGGMWEGMFVDNVQHGEGVFTSETGRKDIHVYDHGRVVKVTMGEVEDSGSGSVSGSGSGPGNSNDSKGQEL